MKYLRGMRGIKPTPLKLYFIATPATDGPSLATPSESCFQYPLVLFASMLVAPARILFPSFLSSPFLAFSISLTCTAAQSYTQRRNTAGSKATLPFHPRIHSLSLSLPLPSPYLTLSLFLSPLRYRPSRRGVSPYNETPETSLQIQPLGGARYLSSEAFLSFGCIPDAPLAPSRALAITPRCALSLLLFFFASSLSLPNAISLVDRNIFCGYTRIGGGEFITVTDHPLFLSLFPCRGSKGDSLFRFSSAVRATKVSKVDT